MGYSSLFYLKIYMIVNFKIYKISWDMYKLIRTLILIKKYIIIIGEK
jgi:hypothetical protein